VRVTSGAQKNIRLRLLRYALGHKRPMGQKQTSAWRSLMSALLPKADITGRREDVRFVPKADIGTPIAGHLVPGAISPRGN
jgi:hypothetical protein